MTDNNHNTPNPYHAESRVKPKADLRPSGAAITAPATSRRSTASIASTDTSTI